MMGYTTLRPTGSISKTDQSGQGSTLPLEPARTRWYVPWWLWRTSCERASLPSFLVSHWSGLPLTCQFVTSELRTLSAAWNIPQSADFISHFFQDQSCRLCSYSPGARVPDPPPGSLEKRQTEEAVSVAARPRLFSCDKSCYAGKPTPILCMSSCIVQHPQRSPNNVLLCRILAVRMWGP